MNTTIVILLLTTMIPTFLIMMFIPYWTRKTESFGVSIPEAMYNDASIKAMRKQYAVIIGVVSSIFIAVFLMFSFFLTVDEQVLSTIFGAIIIIFLICSFLVYLHFYRKMKDLKQVENWFQGKTEQIVIDTQFRQQKLIYSNLWFIFSFIIAFITIIFTLQFYQLIPDRIPMQYNLSGEITNWVDKSYRTVLMMPVMQVYMSLLFLFINTIIAKAKQQVSVENPDKSLIQNITFRRRWSLFTIISGTALVIMFSLIQFSFFYEVEPTILYILPLVITFGIIIGAVILSITTGQGGSRLGKVKSVTGQMIDRDEDRYWKLGQFYYNKEDPSLFLEKRFGVGWTNNWARPLSWIILLIIILLALAIPIFLMM